MKDYIVSTAWIAGLMLAPHSLALLGNLAGVFQWILLLLLGAGVAVYWLNSASLAAMLDYSPLPANELPSLSEAIGSYAAILVLTAGRVITAVTAATVLLVTAGFAFNETFLYWFPNFGFAFLVLALVVVVRVAGHWPARIFQVLTAGLTLGGLAVLIGMGLWQAPGHPVANPTGAGAISWHMLVSTLLLFAGFDSALNHRFSRPGRMMISMMAGLGLLGLVLGLWSTVSILHVPAEKLADSFIAHLLVARAAGGESGRIVMAMLIIAGTCAAVNALFGNVSRTFTQLMAHLDLPSKMGRCAGHPITGTLLCGLSVALMMAGGMAGTDAIDVYVRAGLYCWLLYYGAVHLGVLILFSRQAAPASLKKLRSAAGVVLMVLSFGTLVFFDPDRTVLVRFMLAAWTVLTALILTGRLFRRLIK